MNAKQYAILHNNVKTRLTMIVNEACEQMNAAYESQSDVYNKIRIIKRQSNDIVTAFIDGVTDTMSIICPKIDRELIEQFATHAIDLIDCHADFLRM